MVVTQKLPESIMSLWEHWKKDKKSKMFRACENAIFHNGEPLNIVKAMTILKEVEVLTRIDYVHPVEFEYSLRYLSEITGYSVIELNERL